MWVSLDRFGTDLVYEFWLSGTTFEDGMFDSTPTGPGADHWVVTEFYAQMVPGYSGARSGLTMWDLDDLSPAFNTDLLRLRPSAIWMKSGMLSSMAMGPFAIRSAKVSPSTNSIIKHCRPSCSSSPCNVAMFG